MGDQPGGTSSQPNMPSVTNFLVVGVVADDGCGIRPLSFVKTTLVFCVVEALSEDERPDKPTRNAAPITT